uniref:Uncharacterized protein n=1 Tax=Arundo donax TaxID=35708 RepID=A0A0A9Q6X0_ARUDO
MMLLLPSASPYRNSGRHPRLGTDPTASLASVHLFMSLAADPLSLFPLPAHRRAIRANKVASSTRRGGAQDRAQGLIEVEHRTGHQ